MQAVYKDTWLYPESYLLNELDKVDIPSPSASMVNQYKDSSGEEWI